MVKIGAIQDACVVKFQSKVLETLYKEKITLRSDVMVVIDGRKYGEFYAVNLYCPVSNYRVNYYLSPDTEVEILEDTKIMEKYRDYQFDNMNGTSGFRWLIGSDPEMFVEDEKGIVIPAFNFLDKKGGKDKTYPAGEKGNFLISANHGGKSIYWDGFQAEFETCADTCLGWLSDSIYAGIRALHDKAKAHNPNAKLSSKTTMDIPIEMLEKSADEHVAFGCNPSLNLYGMEGVRMDGREVPFRSAGGHMHFGCADLGKEKILNGVKGMDFLLAVAWVSLFEKYDDGKRRSMYGLAGEYRLPKHGLEYRVLSNAWMFHPVLTNLTYDFGRQAFMFGANGLLDAYYKADKDEVITAINNHDVALARKIIKRNEKLFVKILGNKYGAAKSGELLFKGIVEGADSFITNMNDIATNWNIGTKTAWTSHSNGAGKNVASAARTLVEGKKVS